MFPNTVNLEKIAPHEICKFCEAVKTQTLQNANTSGSVQLCVGTLLFYIIQKVIVKPTVEPPDSNI